MIETMLLVSSKLGDPICYTRCRYYQMRIIDHMYPDGSYVSNLAKKIDLCVEMIFWAALAPLMTLPAVVLRYAAYCFQSQPFVSAIGLGVYQVLGARRTFTTFIWNVCCVPAHEITDGGVRPWRERIEQIANRILKQKADVVGLCEVFDFQAALYLRERLEKAGYRDFYYSIGQGLVPSALFVASKFQTANPEFTPFPLETLVGRTKNAVKGVFTVDLVSKGVKFANFNLFHGQHAEEPAYPREEELIGVRAQMNLIIDKIKQVRDRCIVVAGDFNFGDYEYDEWNLDDPFMRGEEDPFTRTWPGDEFSAQLMGKRPSGGLNLDRTLVRRGTARQITTTRIPTGYNPRRIGGLSDHWGLRTEIILNGESPSEPHP